jgi:hypothetical protein
VYGSQVIDGIRTLDEPSGGVRRSSEVSVTGATSVKERVGLPGAGLATPFPSMACTYQ